MKKTLLVMVISSLFSLTLFAQSLHVVLVGDLYDINPKKDGRGGYAKLAGVLSSYRSQGKTLFVHAGDAFSPSLISSITKGSHAVRLLNAMFLDYFVPGNHEFDFGSQIALKRFDEAKFKILAGNILYKNKAIPDTLATDIIDVDGVKVGIYGLLTPRTASLNPNSGLTIGELQQNAAKFHDALKKQGAEFIMALVQTDIVEDTALVNSGYADTVLSGDDHVNLTFDNGKTTWLESGEDAKKIAVLTVEFTRDSAGKLSWEQTIHTVDTKTVKEDGAIKGIVDEYNTLLDAEFGKVIGKSSIPISSERALVRSAESGMGNLIADAIREKLSTDVAIINGGGIRGNKVYPAGTELTRKDILTELPFGNVATAIKVKGSVIQAALENGVSEFEAGAGRFPQVSGMSFVWSAKAEKGKRVKEIVINGKPLNRDAEYTLATNDYMMDGGDNYVSLKGQTVLVDASSAELMATIVNEYIESKKTVSPQIEGRIKRLD